MWLLYVLIGVVVVDISLYVIYRIVKKKSDKQARNLVEEDNNDK